VHDDDVRLIAALTEGDEAAFRAFSHSVQRPLLGLVRRLVGEDGVDDVVQQTWVSMFESLPRFEGRSRLSTWLLQIALHHARGVLRRRERSVPLSDDDEPPDARFTKDWRVSADDPEQAASNRELLTALERALRALPENWRIAVTLCDIEGVAPHEAAAVLEVEAGHLRVLLHRGRARLRESLEVELGV
jgi:RNA polymerase sigma-70 factor, ECF subfamily